MELPNNALDRILTEIEAVSDVMFNAMKVDEFDIFETQLALREALLNDFDKIASVEVDLMQTESVRMRLKKLYEKDQQIEIEMNRYKSQLDIEFKDVVREKNLLIQNKNRTNKYNRTSINATSGSIFDKKK